MIYIFTHDSIGVGEDGPTHQPIEQLASLGRSPASSFSDLPMPTRSSKPGKSSCSSSTTQRRSSSRVRTSLMLDRENFAPASGWPRSRLDVLAYTPGGQPDVLFYGLRQ